MNRAPSPLTRPRAARGPEDTESRGIHKVVDFGTGVTDVHGIVRALLERGYSGYLVIEEAPPLNRDTLLADMRRAVAMFRQYER